MKKLESTLTNLILVLVLVSLITGGLLAYVNHITEEPIAMQTEKTLSDGIKKVMGSSNITITANDTIKQQIEGKKVFFIIHTVTQNDKKRGAAVESTTLGFGGNLKVLVGFNNAGNILGYTILSTSETPGLGAKADNWFQKNGKGNIIGKNLAHGFLIVKKDGGNVDAITASTITSRAFLKAINQAYSAYNEKLDSNSCASKIVKKNKYEIHQNIN